VKDLNKIGVSPVIAVLLLVVISVIAGTLLYVWLTGYMGTLQTGVGTEQLKEKIKIEGVKYESSDTTGTVTVYVRNIGDTKVTLNAVYLYNASGTVVAADTDENVELDPGEVGTIPQTNGNDLSCTLSSGKTYTVKVVTQRGTEATYTFTYKE